MYERCISCNEIRSRNTFILWHEDCDQRFFQDRKKPIARYIVRREKYRTQRDWYTDENSRLWLDERPTSTYSKHERLRFFSYGNFRWPRDTYVKRKCCQFLFSHFSPVRILNMKRCIQTCNVSYCCNVTSKILHFLLQPLILYVYFPYIN